MVEPTPLIEAVDLSAGYGSVAVIRHVDLAVRPGEISVLVGPNGAGKSTTMLTLSGMIRPMDGEVRIDGEPTTSPLHQRARQGLSFVPEQRSVIMELTTAENLRVARVDTADALDLFPELERLLGQKAGLLSGGEQQMLSLARALARKPKVLLADELSLGLAPLVVERLLTAVQQAAKDRDVAVLLVEQHVHLALAIADSVAVMRRGEIVFQGTPAAINDDPTLLERAYFSDSDEAAASETGLAAAGESKTGDDR